MKWWVTPLLVGMLAAPLSAQLGGLLGKKGDPKEKEAKATAKNQASYAKLREYSLDKYQSDPDFRDRVDDQYESLLRSHSERAYQKNVSVASRIITVREDRWRIHENLYDNLLVQDHINRIGQKLVPATSERLFAFKVVPDPTPLAETLSTGTVYISTGLLSLLDSEAQVAYVLAHEMAHVELDHWKERVILDEGQDAYAAEQNIKRARIALLGGIAGGVIGGLAGGKGDIGLGAAIGAGAGFVAGLVLDRPLIVNWERAEEDAADEMAFKALLNVSYDVREIPNLYVAMQKATLRDARVGLGFLGSRKRVGQRLEKSRDLIANAYKADIETKLQKGFMQTSPEHTNLMAELKRDNGIMAYYHDMFELARTNLKDAVAIRSNDPAAHYYYGKVLKLVGHTDEDARDARKQFLEATKTDKHDENFGSHLHLALMLAHEKDSDAKLVTGELDEYVTGYARSNATDLAFRAFPPNLETIYQYMSLFGIQDWWPKPPKTDFLAAYQGLIAAAAANAAQNPAPAPAAAVSPAAAPQPARTPGAAPQPARAPGVTPRTVLGLPRKQ